MNVHDSEVLAGMLEKEGYTPAASVEAADLILLNTCCVRENAENRIFGHIGNLKALKEEKPELIIGVCGCMAQEPGEVEKIKTKFPWVDLIFGTHNLHQLPELLRQATGTHSRVIEVWDHDGAIVEGLPVKRSGRFRAWVTIMYGCNNFCAYCIVPHVRGRERSRRPEAILEEIRELVRDGVQEVTLLGQNVNSYGLDLADAGGPEGIRNFAGLLRAIARGTGIRRIRFQTSHPKDLSEELIAVMAEEPNICRHLHLPVQAGSSRVLQLMNRRYTKERYLELVARLKMRIPDISLTTDIIVGFPGEREEDFRETLDLVNQVRYDGAFTFIYSRRVGTPAAGFGDPVPEAEKKQWLMELINLQNRISLEKNRDWVGRITKLLVDGPSERNQRVWSGRNSQNKLVHFAPSAGVKEGDFINVRITKAQTFTLEGEIV
ncbi:MAG: tRNA (N6-isopentenyl adenosine(37)-C2)-methylthiotransferase MiaB [Firmicutes bacterium]|nr:tRNA (N6-isopentenyl adenosine(37)-C2)-methylthiotransferase MiaB [Bacillota bacterium]